MPVVWQTATEDVVAPRRRFLLPRAPGAVPSAARPEPASGSRGTSRAAAAAGKAGSHALAASRGLRRGGAAPRGGVRLSRRRSRAGGPLAEAARDRLGGAVAACERNSCIAPRAQGRSVGSPCRHRIAEDGAGPRVHTRPNRAARRCAPGACSGRHPFSPVSATSPVPGGRAARRQERSPAAAGAAAAAAGTLAQASAHPPRGHSPNDWGGSAAAGRLTARRRGRKLDRRRGAGASPASPRGIHSSPSWRALHCGPHRDLLASRCPAGARRTGAGGPCTARPLRRNGLLLDLFAGRAPAWGRRRTEGGPIGAKTGRGPARFFANNDRGAGPRCCPPRLAVAAPWHGPAGFREPAPAGSARARFPAR